MSEFKLYVYDKITKAVISGYNGIDITGNSYTITGLTDNTEYTIKMRRYDENGNLSNISKTKDVITDNATIPNILVTNENFARFEVYFDAIPNASGYLVYLSKDGNPVDNYNPYFSNTNDFAITGLTPESTYSFYIETSYGGKTSQPSDTYTAITETVNLDNPSNLVISNVNYRFSTITWDNVLDATHYDVYIENVAVTGMNQYWDTTSISGLTSFPASITGSNSFTFNDGLPLEKFRYYVKARYYNYESDYIQSTSGSFSIVPDTTALEETNVTTSGFTVNFNKVLDIGNVNQSGYYVYLYKSGILQNTIVLTNQNGSASFMNGSSGFVTLTSGMISPTGISETMYILKPNGSYETNLEILDNTTYTYKIKPHYKFNASSGFSNEISVTTDEINTVPTTRDLVLNSNTAIYMPFRDGTANNTYGAGNNGGVQGTHSFPTGILSGDATYLDLSADGNYVNISNSSALDAVDLTVDMAFQFTSFKTVNLLASKYQTNFGNTYRKFYFDYYHPTNEFRVDLHNPINSNNSDYAQWRISFTPSLNTNYLISIAIDTTNNIIKFFINGVEQTMNFVGGSLGGIAGVDWSTPDPAMLRICAYQDLNGINSGANADANIRLFRFGYHKEYRNLAVHTQSYNNLFNAPDFTNNHAWNMLYNSDSMVGSGLSITDSINSIVANFYRNTSHNGTSDYPTWTSDATFGNGILFNKPASALRITDNANIDTYQKFTILLALEFDQKDIYQMLLNKVSSTNINNNAYQFYIDSDNKSKSIVRGSVPTSSYFNNSTNTVIETSDIGNVIGLALSVDCIAGTIFFVKNQTTYNVTSPTLPVVTQDSTMDLFFGSFLWENGASYYSNTEFKGKLYRLAFIKDVLTDTQIKAEFAQMGLT